MLTIHKNAGSALHNTSKRPGKIEYLAIHYVGGTGDAEANVKYYNRLSTTNASADFFVGHRGDIWQYNPDPLKRYCWAVGGKKYANGGGRLYGRATNKNTISIEMCVKLRGGAKQAQANDPAWYITEETLNASIELTRQLMRQYGIPADRVIRHYDVTGKACPGVVGWNPLSGSDAAWKSFQAAISGQADAPKLPYLVRVTIADLHIREKASASSESKGYIKPGVYTIVAEDGIWLKLKSGEGWISSNYVTRL